MNKLTEEDRPASVVEICITLSFLASIIWVSLYPHYKHYTLNESIQEALISNGYNQNQINQEVCRILWYRGTTDELYWFNPREAPTLAYGWVVDNWNGNYSPERIWGVRADRWVIWFIDSETTKDCVPFTPSEIYAKNISCNVDGCIENRDFYDLDYNYEINPHVPEVSDDVPWRMESMSYEKFSSIRDDDDFTISDTINGLYAHSRDIIDIQQWK